MIDNPFDSPLRRFVNLVLIGLIALALMGVALVATPGSPWQKKPKLGLDLRGGVEVVLKAVPADGKPPSWEEMEQSLGIVRLRIDNLGVSEHDVRKQGRDQIVVQLAGLHDPDEAARVIGATAQLDLYDAQADLLVGPQRSLHALLTAARSRLPLGTPSSWYLFDGSRRLVAGPEPTRTALAGAYGRVRGDPTILAVPARTVVLTCTVGGLCPGRVDGPEQSTVYYLFRHDPSGGVPEMSGDDFKPSAIDYDPEAAQHLPLGLTPAGARRLHRLTVRQARRARESGQQPISAIVLDGEIESVVGFDYREFPNGIRDTRIDITSRNALALADLAAVLSTGSLPVSFEQVGQVEVSATLGRDSLREAKQAVVFGLLLVALLLLLLYRLLGLVAIAGLVIYAAFLYAVILRLNVTLTLPGIAGLVLTIGLAADANVVIFERIKEEVRRGKQVFPAIDAGYSKGFRTIVDAHVVTAITAVMLFLIASTRVRGFAVMLLFGAIVSLFTAVAATRALLGLLAGFGWFGNARLLGAEGRQRWAFLDLDFVRHRRVWFAASAAMIAICGAALATRGLNLGIDFRGGSQFTFQTARPHATEDVRRVIGVIHRADAVVQGRGQAARGAYRSWQVRTKALTGAEKTAIQNQLRERLDAGRFGVTIVSASFGRQVAWRTLWALLGSLVLIVLYVKWRFGPRYALPIVVALLNDLALTVGVYSLSGRTVNTSTLAAVLAVLGYSIYDTVIIFDRIRHNSEIMAHVRFERIVNLSLRQTIRRSLITTCITLLPVASLLLFGGATLNDFAFALLVGIASGAYSSIFLAAPLRAMLKPPAKPAWARRRKAAAAT